MIRRPYWCPKFSWRQVVVVLAMSALIVGVFVLVLVLAARGQQHILSSSKAEPIWHEASLITFPFENEGWANMSSEGVCPRHTFPCTSSRRCLTLGRRCDGNVDCLGAEDEASCACAFRMPSVRFCDAYPDCFDESDEAFCSYCPQNYFNCGEGECVPREKVCDSHVDCHNFMDENFCFRLSSELAGIDLKPGLSSGFLMRNQKGHWYPVCANPYDYMESALANFACVSVTANPLATAKHSNRIFQSERTRDYYIYHYQGRFVKWRGCVSQSGLLVTCEDIRCGLNPKHMLPRRPRGRIVGGERSQPGAWPWHAAIYRNGSYSCGATLINSRWLISAAHCFLNYAHSYYEVQLGMLRRKSFTPHQKTYALDRVKIHPDFNIATLDYDIALLRTAIGVVFDFWIRPICLPRPEMAESSGSMCTAIGWGDTSELDDDSEDLLEVRVPITKSCRRNQDRWLCAGYIEGGRDACQGDSGGPLMCLQDDGLSWYVAGIISGGTGCARPRTPGMYTRVAYFVDWIKHIILNEVTNVPPLKRCPWFPCAALGGGDCLEKKKVCDGHVDCYDASDELNCIIK